MRYIYVYLMLLVMLLCGCSTTYVPISWNYGEKVKKLSNTDATLKILYSRYDPQRQTLRVRAASFEEVMMPYEVKYHLGAYRPDTRILYRNLYHEYDEKELRDVMVHEFAHHIWFAHMTTDQRDKWKQYLALNPSPLQAMVRSIYSRPTEFDTEDFAFIVSHPRRIDIEKLASLNIINEEERDALIKELPSEKPIKPPKKGSVVASGSGPAKTSAPSEKSVPASKSGSVEASGPDPEKTAAPAEKSTPAPNAGSVVASGPDPGQAAAPGEKSTPAPNAGSVAAPDAAPEKTATPSETPTPAPSSGSVAASAPDPATTPAPPVMDKGHH